MILEIKHVMIIYSKCMCYLSFFDEENADQTLGLNTVKTKEMFRLLHEKENNNTNN